MAQRRVIERQGGEKPVAGADGRRRVKGRAVVGQTAEAVGIVGTEP